MMIGTLAIWVLITFAIVWVVQSAGTTAAPPGNDSGPANVTTTAERILAERLARGEIDSEEYRARLDALASTRG